MHSKRGFSSRVGTLISPKPSSNRICRFPFLLFRQRIDIRTSVLPSPEGETNITPGEEHAVRRNPGYRPTPRSAPGGRHCGRSSKCGCQCISKCEAHRNLKSSSKPDNHKPYQPPTPPQENHNSYQHPSPPPPENRNPYSSTQLTSLFLDSFHLLLGTAPRTASPVHLNCDSYI